MDKPALNDEDELRLLALAHNKLPCEWVELAARMGIACATVCHCKDAVLEEYREIKADRAMQKIQEDYIDG